MKIIIAGHFGTLYSYATVAGRVAEALRAHGLLAGCHNIDSGWHPRWASLRGDPEGGTHVVVVAAPNHYISNYAEGYGRERSAIFVSPNTDTLADEHVETISKFSLAIAPSRFCATTVGEKCRVDSLSVLPLGTALVPGSARRPVVTEEPVRVVHFTSDQAWPSRKGTEALVRAWACRRPDVPAVLTIHGPPSLRKSALYAIADAEVDETVSYEPSPSHGTDDADLGALYAQADLIVAPSRSEGFGMMMLGALVGGVPLLTTCNTGHAEFLTLRPGAWLPIPTATTGPLAYEAGNAPVIDFETLTEMLGLAITPFAREWMMKSDFSYGEASRPDWGTWDWALAQWVERLKDWMEDTR